MPTEWEVRPTPPSPRQTGSNISQQTDQSGSPRRADSTGGGWNASNANNNNSTGLIIRQQNAQESSIGASLERNLWRHLHFGYHPSMLTLPQLMHMTGQFFTDSAPKEAFDDFSKFLVQKMKESAPEKSEREQRVKHAKFVEARRRKSAQLFRQLDSGSYGSIKFDCLEELVHRYEDAKYLNAFNEAKNAFIENLTQHIMAAHPLLTHVPMRRVRLCEVQFESLLREIIPSTDQTSCLLDLDALAQIMRSTMNEDPVECELGRMRRRWLDSIRGAAEHPLNSMEFICEKAIQALVNQAKAENYFSNQLRIFVSVTKFDSSAESYYTVTYPSKTKANRTQFSFGSDEYQHALNTGYIFIDSPFSTVGCDEDTSESKQHLQSCVAIPILTYNLDVIGFLCIDSPMLTEDLITREFSFYEAVASQIGLSFIPVTKRNVLHQAVSDGFQWLRAQLERPCRMYFYLCLDLPREELDVTARQCDLVPVVKTHEIPCSHPRFEFVHRSTASFKSYLFTVVDTAEPFHPVSLDEQHLVYPLLGTDGTTVGVVDVAFENPESPAETELSAVRDLLTTLNRIYLDLEKKCQPILCQNQSVVCQARLNVEHSDIFLHLCLQSLEDIADLLKEQLQQLPATYPSTLTQADIDFARTTWQILEDRVESMDDQSVLQNVLQTITKHDMAAQVDLNKVRHLLQTYHHRDHLCDSPELIKLIHQWLKYYRSALEIRQSHQHTERPIQLPE